MKKVIKNGLVITMDPNRKKQYEALDIVITDNLITEMVDNYQGQADMIIDAGGKIVIPGLINCHTHLGMSVFRATNDNLNLNDWLTKKIWPLEAQMTDQDIYYTTLLSCVEMIKTGTTTNNDMYFGWQESIKAINETKIRQVFTRTLIGDNDENALAKIADFEALYKQYQSCPLVTFMVAIHSLYTTNQDYIAACSALASKYNLPIHIHLSENKNEVETITQKYQNKPVNALKELGLLDHKLLLAHGTFIDEEEQKILAQHDVAICHNPISNLNLGCGIADITSYLKTGLNVCLGTDGQGSGNNLNLFYHMSMVDLLQKAIYQDPTIMSSYDVLKIATINGAQALGLESKIGSIEPGKLADLIILDLNNTEIYPTVDLITQVVHNVQSNNIDFTIINGEILMANHELLIPVDEMILKTKIDEIINKIKM